MSEFEKNNSKKGIFKYIAVVLLVAIVLVLLFIIFKVSSVKQLVCTSSDGNITIKYNKKTLVDYQAEVMTFNLKEQREYAEKIGVENYLKDFGEWFSSNTDGICVNEK